MMLHSINGKLWDIDRVDFQVPWGELEIWEYRNVSVQPYPMHLHAPLFQVLDRNGSLQIRPEDKGWKDTVLVDPNETVRVLVRFDTHPGVFVHHCHNLEHEDSGMMQNFQVLPPVELDIELSPGGTIVSWPDALKGWLLKSSPSLESDSSWQSVSQSPIKAEGKWTVTIPDVSEHQFYRLVKGG